MSGCRVEQQPPEKAAPAQPAAESPAPKAAPVAPPPPAPKPAATAPAEPPPQPAAAAPAPMAPITGIGRIEALEGEVRLERAAGEVRAENGMALEEGDTITAAADAWALLAMKDGATVTLRPDSQVVLEAYRYTPDGPPSGNSARLFVAKGAMRSITGEIGKTNPAGYEVKTPGASIGIQGTDHEPAYYPPLKPGEKSEQPAGTYDKVNAGETVIRAGSGALPIKAGQTAFSTKKAGPRLLERPPAFYQRQAELDKRVEARRAEFHKVFDAQREKRLQEQKQQRADAARKAQDARKAKQESAPAKAANQKQGAQQHKQKPRQQSAQQRQQAHNGQQGQRRPQRPASTAKKAKDAE